MANAWAHLLTLLRSFFCIGLSLLLILIFLALVVLFRFTLLLVLSRLLCFFLFLVFFSLLSTTFLVFLLGLGLLLVLRAIKLKSQQSQIYNLHHGTTSPRMNVKFTPRSGVLRSTGARIGVT